MQLKPLGQFFDLQAVLQSMCGHLVSSHETGSAPRTGPVCLGVAPLGHLALRPCPVTHRQPVRR